MERAYLGSTGIRVSRIVLGCGNFGGVGSSPAFFGRGESREDAFAIMDAAWASGSVCAPAPAAAGDLHLVPPPTATHVSEPGSIVTWENATFPSGSAFVVELPAGPLTPPVALRFAIDAIAR